MIFANLIEDYPYETAPIKRLIPIRHFGLEPDYMGGIYPYIAELKNGIHLVVDKNLKTKATFLNPNTLESVNGDIIKQFAKGNVEFDWKKATKEELISKLRGTP